MRHNEHLRSACRYGAILISLLAIATPAFAEEVSGRVYLNGSRFVGTLRLPDGSQVEINGEYRLVMPAGEYHVTFVQSGRPFPAIIQSSTVPVRQDIKLDSSR
jgi:hypothetical protein